MSLESLLTRLEARARIAEGDAGPVTPVTAERTVASQEKTLQNNDVTPVTAVTPISRDGNSDSSMGKGSGLPQPEISVGGLFSLTSQTSQTSQPSPGAALGPVLAVTPRKGRASQASRPNLPGVSPEIEIIREFFGLEPPKATPALVRCCDCASFVADTIGDGMGVGACAVDGEGSRPRGRWGTRPALWAREEYSEGDAGVGGRHGKT